MQRCPSSLPRKGSTYYNIGAGPRPTGIAASLLGHDLNQVVFKARSRRVSRRLREAPGEGVLQRCSMSSKSRTALTAFWRGLSASHLNPLPCIPIAMPEPSSAGVSRATRFLTVSLARELGILLCLSVMFPFMIHVIPVPENAQLGPRLLPMFYAPLLAALLGRTRSALVVALLAPWLNWALTSYPFPRSALVMMVQLLAFVVAVRALLAGFGARWFIATPAYLSGMAAAVLAAAIFPGLIGGRGALEWAAHTVAIGLPGIAILMLINWLAIRCYPSGPAGCAPLAA